MRVVLMYEFYREVPKDLNKNLEYRIELRERAQSDKTLQRALLSACRHDVLFFFNAFCWLYEPRPQIVNGVKMPHIIPFVTWPHQDKGIKRIKDYLGFEDIGIEKSRGEGASWICLLLAVHEWIFDPMTAIGFVSRSEDAVDNPEDPDSLMWKVDWVLSKLPFWMKPALKRNLSEHTLRNLDNGSTITGYAATGDVASGGRKKWFLMDELAKFPRGPDKEAMASTQHVTNSRIIPSTPKGSEGAYYDVMHEPSSLVKVTLSWKDNPTKNRGLYQLIDNHCIAVDPENNPLPDGYEKQSQELLSRLRAKGFKLEGKLRSPWYDHECDRAGANPQNIAQELDLDYGGSMFRVFGTEFFEKAEKSVLLPGLRGTMSWHPETLEPDFSTSDDGPCLLWTTLDAYGKPPRHQYVLGADICTGLGGAYTSNSVASVIDMVTMEQVFEFSSNTVEPKDFAEQCIVFAKWFHNAYLIWEHNGPGAGFTRRILDKRYPDIYFRTILWKQGKNKKTKEAGWWTDSKTKQHMFGELSRSVKGGEVVLRSDQLVKECGQYVWLNGSIEHVLTVSSKDETTTGKSHGDRVIATCVCLQGVRDRPLLSRSYSEGGDTENPPPGTMAARQKAYEDARHSSDTVWDDRTTADLARRFS